MGRLSNLPEHLVDKGVDNAEHGLKRRLQGPQTVATVATTMTSEESGRLSNPTPQPVQRRHGRSEIDTIVSDYQAGRSIRTIAKLVGVHHHTVAAHLQRRGVARRLNQRTMNSAVAVEASLSSLQHRWTI